MKPPKRPLSVLDSTFLRIETTDTPMHVGALMEFALPDNAGEDFVSTVVAKLREPLPLRQPFNQRLVRTATSALAPAATAVESIDMEYHVRHTALPRPGSERELGELVSHLHSARLDRSRPLWTCHVIEGLDDGRFAIFIKMHHSLTDGINGIRLATDQLALNPDGDWRAPWHAPTEQKPRKRSKASGSNSLGPLKTAAGVSRGLRTLRRGSEPVVLPFQAPASSRNLKVTNARRVATQRLEMTRMKAVANQTSTSLNDVLVAVCGDALRRYLIDHQQLPERSLVAGVPVSLREDGEHGGNAVGFLWADLGTDTDDPLQRLDAVHRSMTAAKEHLKTMPKAARPAFTMLTMVLPVATLLSGQAPRLLDRR